MRTKKLSMLEFADLLSLEDQQGIIDGADVIDQISNNRFTGVVHDVRGALRLAVERADGGLEVTQYPTELSQERLSEPQ